MALDPVFHGKNLATLLVLGLVSFSSYSSAQGPASVESHSTVEPSIGIELLYDDNIFLNATDKQSSLITTLSPGLLASFVPYKHRFELEYNGEFASYAESSSENYSDHEFRAEANLDLGLRSQLDVIARLDDAHQNRGTGLTEGLGSEAGLLLDEFDKYQETQVLGRFTYGATGAKGRLVFEAGQQALEFKNNRERTQFFDYEALSGGMTAYVRVMPSTSLVLDVRATDYNYQIDRILQPSLDSSEYRYLLGATWDITGKTTGTVKVGFAEKSYDDNRRGDFSGTSWEADIRWFARSYSYFDFSTRRFPSEVTSVTGDFIDNTTYSVTWSHAWSGRILSRLTAGLEDRDFRGSAGARVQERKWSRLTLAYNMSRWLTWRFSVTVSAQEGTFDRFDYDNNLVGLGAYFTF